MIQFADHIFQMGWFNHQPDAHFISWLHGFFSIKNPTHPWHSKPLKPSRNLGPLFFWNTGNVINVGSNVTAFSFIFVEYIKNVYGWSDSAPPGGLQGWKIFVPRKIGGEISGGETKEVGFYKTKTWNKNPWKSMSNGSRWKTELDPIFFGNVSCRNLGFHDPIWHTIFFRWVEITNYRNGFGPRRPKKQFHQVGRRRIRTFNGQTLTSRVWFLLIFLRN